MSEPDDQKPPLDSIPRLVAEILESPEGLPVLPQIVEELRRTLDDKSCDMRKVAGVVEKDPSLTVRVLKVANSVFHGFAGKVTTVQLACSLLGQATIEGLVTTVSVMNALRTGSDDCFDPVKFWSHSLQTGLCALDVADHLHYKLRGDVFTCGILHDIGKIVMSHLRRDEYRKMMALHRGGMPYREAEIQTYGADHTQIGLWVAQRWSLPETFAACIRGHHDWPEVRETMMQKRVAAVYVGNLLAHLNAYRVDRGRYPVLRPEFTERFGLSEADTLRIAEAALDKARGMLHELIGDAKGKPR